MQSHIREATVRPRRRGEAARLLLFEFLKALYYNVEIGFLKYLSQTVFYFLTIFFNMSYFPFPINILYLSVLKEKLRIHKKVEMRILAIK